MININNYILEKLHITKKYYEADLANEIIHLCWGTDKDYFIANQKDDMDKGIDRINEWIKKYHVNKVSYITNFDFNEKSYADYFNLDEIKKIGAKRDKERISAVENEMVDNRNTIKYDDTKYVLNIRGNKTYIIFNDKSLYLTMSYKNNDWLVIVVINDEKDK